MSVESNIALTKALLEGLGARGNPTQTADLFTEDLSFEVQGDDGVLPWIGHKVGRQAVINFMHDRDGLIEPLAFDIEDILASETRAAIIGWLRSRMKATGKVVATQFAIVLTIANGKIGRFQMLEDSFGVSKAAR